MQDIQGSNHPDSPKDQLDSRSDNENADVEASVPALEIAKEIEALSQLFSRLPVDDDEEEEEIDLSSGEELTKDNYLNLLQSYERQLTKKMSGKGLLLVRFNQAKQRLRKLQLEKKDKDDALRKFEEQKDALLETLGEEAERLKKDIEQLKEVLIANYGYDKDVVVKTPLELEQNGITIKWNPKNPEHDALHRQFKEVNIPLIEGSNEVDYSKVKMTVFANAPTLDLDVSKLPVEDMIKEIATRVVNFRDDFERFYKCAISDLLFDKMAWRYMSGSLNKVSSLAKDYTDLVQELPMRDRNWKQVVTCLNKALKFEQLEAHLADEVLMTRPKPGESLITFSQRLKPLLEAAEFPDDGCSLLIRALGNHVSDIGFQATLKEYGSFSEVKSIKAYLKFLAETPGAMEGTRTEKTHWFLQKYGGKSGAQAFARLESKSKSEQLEKTATQGKRSSSSDEQKDQNRKKQKLDVPICTFSEKCKMKRLRHHQHQCYHFQNEQKKKELGDNGNGSKKTGFKPVKAVGAFAKISEDAQLGAIQLNKESFFSTYSPFRIVDLKQVYAFKGPAPGDNRIAVPIGIMGVQCTALLDLGATLSLINKDLADDFNIRYGKVPNEAIGMIESGKKADSIITCDKVQLVCNKRSVEYQIHVMEFDYYDFVIGMDLFARFGFQVTGMVMPEPREEEFLWVPSDEKPSIVPLETPLKERTPEFRKQKEDFMKELEPSLQKNAAVDPQSHCTLDSMRVVLKVKPNCVIQERSRPFHAQIEKEEVDRTVKKWWDTGVIVLAPKGNPYNNSLTMAARRDLDGNITKYRVCLDPRTLNRQLEDTDNFPLPLVTDIQQRVAGHKYITTIDLSQAYHRMPVDEASQPLTAFTYNGKQYMFARAPFGLKPLTSIFQRGMSELLGDLHYGDNYVDDIIVYSREVEEHLAHTRLIIDRLTEVKLIINREKCKFLSTEVLLLGFIVNEEGRRVNTEKIANVQAWALPTNKKMIQRYLGLFNYFREYIPLYSTITAPLDQLRNAKGRFELNELQRKSFDAIRNLIARAPVLTFPNFKEPFYVATDASNVGIGAVLYQLPNGRDDTSKVHYVSFQARALHKHEKNYPAYKKELLGIIFALMKFHQYLWGRRFTLYTDHRPLTYIHEQKELPQIITNWKATLLNYNFECVYRPGLLNVIPDALSRAFPDELWMSTESTNSKVSSKKHNIAAVTRTGLRRTKPANAAEETIITSTELAERLSTVPIDHEAPYMHVMQSEDMQRDTVLDTEERKQLLKQVHEFGHLGGNAMVKAIHERGHTWPKLREDCLAWVSKCGPCQHFNIARKGYHPLKAIHARLPGEHVAIDLASFETSTCGNNFALVMVDICTRFVFLEPLPNKEAKTVASALFKLFCTIGFPKIIQSDNGTEFVNEITKLMAFKLQVEHRLSTPYHPRSNGVAERYVRALKDTLRKQLEGRVDTWDAYLPITQLQLNVRAASLHSSTPFSLFFGRSFAGLTDFSSAESHLMTEEELERRLEYLTKIVFPAVSEKSAESQRKMIDKFNRSHRILEFPPGSFVMARDPLAEGKLAPKYQGPYKVMARTENGSYTLLDAMNQTLIRDYAPEQLKLVTQALDVETDESYEVEAILGHELTPGGMMYTVKWKGYDSSHNSQLPYDNFDSDKLVRKYWKQLKQQNPHAVAKQARKDQRAQRKVLKQQKAQEKPISKDATNSRKRKGKPLPRKKNASSKQ